MKILVTGGAGFIGSAVAKKLIERGDDVFIVDDFNNYYNPKLKEDRVSHLLAIDKGRIFRVDISDYNALEKIFKKQTFDVIIHLAAQAGVRYSITHPFVYEKTNVLGTLNILELARHYKVPKIVSASSSSVYGGNTKFPSSEDDKVDNPISLYAATKKAAELMCYNYFHLFGIKSACLRFFTVYGPWGRPDMALFLFTKAIIAGKTIDVFNYGNMEKDFTFIDDIVDGVVKTIDAEFDYEIINLGNNKPVELNRFIEIIENKLGKKAEKNLMPMQAGDVKKSYADIKKAKQLLGWEPKTSIEEGVGKFVEWYRTYYKS